MRAGPGAVAQARVLQASFAARCPRLPGVAVAQPRGSAQPQAAGNAMTLPASFRLPAGGGRPLPEGVRQKMEAAFRAPFADVRVLVGPEPQAIGALAFTVGNTIVFAPGQYAPETSRGQQLLGHELAHVLQQRAGRVRNPFGTGLAVVQDPALEAEAERMAMRAARIEPRAHLPPQPAPPGGAAHAGPALQGKFSIKGTVLDYKFIEQEVLPELKTKKAKTVILGVAKADKVIDFKNLELLTFWAKREEGRIRRRDARERAKDAKLYKNSGKMKHALANHGRSAGKEIRLLIALMTRKRKRKKMESKTVPMMFGSVTVYDVGTSDPGPMVTASIANFMTKSELEQAEKLKKEAQKKKRKRATGTGRRRPGRRLAYVDLVKGFSGCGLTEVEIATMMLAFLNDGTKPGPLVLTKVTHEQRLNMDVFLAASQVSEEARNPGAAKAARTELARIAAGQGHFLTSFTGTTAIFAAARPSGGAESLRQELSGDTENVLAEEGAFNYQSDYSDDDYV